MRQSETKDSPEYALWAGLQCVFGTAFELSADLEDGINPLVVSLPILGL